MPVDDEAARKARAQRLRDQMKRIASPEGESQGAEKSNPPQESQTPRDFVHKRMRDLDKKDRE